MSNHRPLATRYKDQVISYINAGLSIIGVEKKRNTDERFSKTPWNISTRKWQKYQGEILDLTLIDSLLKNCHKIGVVTGHVSGDLEVIDIDDASVYDSFIELIRLALGGDEGKIYQVKTGKGYHIYFRNQFDMSDPPEDVKVGNQPLAKGLKQSDGSTPVRIETRGQGGYVVAPPSEGYSLIKPSSLAEIPTWTQEERETVFNIARSFCLLTEFKEEQRQAVQAAKLERVYSKGSGKTSFKAYNESNDFEEVLTKYGWTKENEDGTYVYWKRPGETKTPYSAKWNKSMRLFWPWTTSSELESQRAYTPTQLRCALENSGIVNNDYLKELTKTLTKEGYGDWKKGAKQSSTGSSSSAGPGKTKNNNKGEINETDTKYLEDFQKAVDYLNSKGIYYDEISRRTKDENGDQLRDRKIKTLTNVEIRQNVKMRKSRSTKFFEDALFSDLITTVNPLMDKYDEVKSLDSDPGVDEIDKLVSQFQINPDFNENTEFYKLLIKTWLYQFPAIINRGTADKMLVLQSEKKNIGKTYFFTDLFPEKWKEYIHVVKADDKDTFADKHKLTNYLFVDDEGVYLNKMSVEGMKAEMSKHSYDFRDAYSRVTEASRRLCVYGATTNNDQLLKESETRRFLIIPIIGRDKDLHDSIDKDKLWTQVFYYWIKNPKSHLLDNKSISKLNEISGKFTIEDSYEGLIRSYLIKPTEKEKYDRGDELYHTATQIKDKLSMRGAGRGIYNFNANTLAKRLKSFGFESKRDREKGNVYLVGFNTEELPNYGSKPDSFFNGHYNGI